MHPLNTGKRIPENHPEQKGLKTFLGHLEDLRGVLLKSLAALVAGLIIVSPFIPEIISWLKAPLVGIVPDPDVFLRTLEVSGGFNVALRTALWSALLVAAPAILYFIGSFVFPGLTVRERQVVLRSSGAAALLFFGGSAMGYYMTLPVALQMMMQINEWVGVQSEWTINSYIAFTIQLLLGFGLAFELPMLVLILGKLGIVSHRQLREKRRHVIVGILVLAMVLTPPDVITQLMMGVPLILLYELCIWIVRVFEREKGTALVEGSGREADLSS